MKQTHIPVKTPLGFLIGRDAIYLSQVQMGEGDLYIEGNINGVLASDPPDKDTDSYYRRRDYLYYLTFSDVMAHSMVELDATYHYESLHEADTDDSNWSSFDELAHSRWVSELGLSDKGLKHYVLSTYDFVFNIVCRKYEMRVYQRVND